MERFVPQLVVAGAICIVFLVGLAAIFFPTRVQVIAVRWGGYTLWGRSKWLLKWIKSDSYVTYLRFMGVYFMVLGALAFAAGLKGGFFWR